MMTDGGWILSVAVADFVRGWRSSLEDIVIAALVMLPFTFAAVILVDQMFGLPDLVNVVLAGLVQGFGMFWNAGWRARTSS